MQLKYQRFFLLLFLAPFALATTFVANWNHLAGYLGASYAPVTGASMVTAPAKAPEKVERNLTKALVLEAPDTLPVISAEPAMQQALYEQINYLRRPDVKKYPIAGLSKRELLDAALLLQKTPSLDPATLRAKFDFYSVNTDLKKERVRITGYYTPIMSVRRERTEEFSYPLLRRPKADIPSPAAIKDGALHNSELALGWVRTKKELENAQLQGSCLIEYPDGQRQFLGFGGSVKGKGGTYVFFTPIDDQVLGCGSFPLTPGYSAAIDPRFIPIGATLLAELPEINAAGKQVGTTYRIIFAQDRGGAIKTTKRMDLYSGIGQQGLAEARKVNRFGRLWLLLPKKVG
jgi:membrane-bound lytic murein transglycosylase A